MFGIITICIIFCCVWCCCLSPDAKARRGNSSSTHENEFGDVVHRDVEVHSDGWGGEEIIVHEEVHHRGRRDSGSSSGGDREFNNFKKDHMEPGR